MKHTLLSMAVLLDGQRASATRGVRWTVPQLPS